MSVLFYWIIFAIGTLLVYFSRNTNLGFIIFSILIILLPITFDLYLRDNDKKWKQYIFLVNLAFLCYIFFSQIFTKFQGFYDKSHIWSFCYIALVFDGFALPFVCHNYKQMISNNSLTFYQRLKYYVWTELFAISSIVVFCCELNQINIC